MSSPIQNNNRILWPEEQTIRNKSTCTIYTNRKNYANLPAEIFLSIFDFTDLTTIYTLTCTTHAFRQLITNSIPNKIFTKLFIHPIHAPVILHGHLGTVKTIQAYPSMSNIDLTCLLIKNNHLKALEMYWKTSSPAADNNIAIRRASRAGHVEIVKLLLQDKRVDPSANSSEAISDAIKIGNMEIVNLLLQDERVNPSADENEGMFWAIENGYKEFVKILLQNKRFDPSVKDNKVIYQAIRCNCLEIVKLTLQDPRVDPRDKNCKIIHLAFTKDNKEVIELFLQHEKVNPAIMLTLALYYKRRDIVELCLENPRLDFSFDPSLEQETERFLKEF